MNAPDARRRWFGMLFLLLAAGMLIWGETVLKPHLLGFSFLVYWLICFAWTALALLVAWIDMRVIRRRTLDEHRNLVQRTLGAAADGEETSAPSPEAPNGKDRDPNPL